MIPKFRAWHKAMQRMSEVLAISYERQKVKIKHQRGTTHMTVPLDDVILMQSIGLVDVNGKEIFERDVIRVSYTDDDFSWTDAIIWSLKDYAWYLKSNKELLGFAMDEADIIVEVIGNIYENPELVEAKND